LRISPLEAGIEDRPFGLEGSFAGGSLLLYPYYAMGNHAALTAVQDDVSFLYL
jgi:hypothetical protein